MKYVERDAYWETAQAERVAKCPQMVTKSYLSRICIYFKKKYVMLMSINCLCSGDLLFLNFVKTFFFPQVHID
jgi:hypothetical protein